MLIASLQNVTKRYGVQTVLEGCSLQISSGQKLGLIGPNGSDKTTILRRLLGVEPPTDGAASQADRSGGLPGSHATGSFRHPRWPSTSTS